MRSLVLISAAAALALGGGVVSSSAAPQLEPPRAAASADAYVTAVAKRHNFGGARVLRASSQPHARVYLRFDLEGITGATVTKATLRLYSLGSSRRGFTVRSTTSRWAERRITFRNAPKGGARIAASGRVRPGLVRIDITRVTRGISSGRPLNLVLTAPNGLVQLASRESSRSRAPRIDFELEIPETLIAAGDIAKCVPERGDAATAALIDNLPGTVAALGDLAYEQGTLNEFNYCYGPTWGTFKARTRPAPGNHEYGTGNANGYFSYWGSVAGNPAQGWYSYDLGAWHVVSLNSNCTFIGGCQAGSPQEAWLRADLVAHKRKCTLAYWHHPLFSAKAFTAELDMKPLFQALYDANADVVLSGHAHNYQRFARQNPEAVADPARGIREFVVGTGGNPAFHPIDLPLTPNLESSIQNTWGVLELSLWSKRFDWQFHPVAGTFTDSGSQNCH